MQTDPNLVKLAIESYAKYDFYKWLYDKKGLTIADIREGNIPVFDKQDFFLYNESTGKDFIVDCSEDAFFARTTGTTGRLFSFAHDNYSGFIDGFFEFASHMKESGRCNIRKIGVSNRASADIINFASLAKAYFDIVIIDMAKGVPEIISEIKHNDIDTILDVSLEFSRFFLKQAVNPCEIGIETVLFLTMDINTRIKLLEYNLNLYSLYSCVEIGIIAITLYDSSDEFTIFAKHLYLEVLEDNRISSTGMGKLICTNPKGMLPLIRYCNGDVVSLRNDTASIYPLLKLYGRDTCAYIPNESEAKADFVQLGKYLSSLPFAKRIFIAQYKADESNSFSKYNLMVSFIEIDCNSPVIADESFSLVVQNESIGTIVKEYARYFPVVFLPVGMIPIESRNKTYLDLTIGQKHERWKAYQHLTDLLIDHGHNIVR